MLDVLCQLAEAKMSQSIAQNILTFKMLISLLVKCMQYAFHFSHKLMSFQ